MRSIHEIINQQYYKKSSWILILLPISLIYFLIISIRKLVFKYGLLKSSKLEVPVIVVGNISTGGTGKTPVVIWLLEKFIKLGHKPGLISRGYKSNANLPQEVLGDSKVMNVGDEPLMIKNRLGVPVFVGKNKVNVGRELLKTHPEINILISDDGLQHFNLIRDFEVLVVDQEREFGNRFLLPAGPLREGLGRINKVDALVMNGVKTVPNTYKMICYGNKLISCVDSENKKNLNEYTSKDKVVAITGIGNPDRFFNLLSDTNIVFERVIFNDHHFFSELDFESYKDTDIIMTEKDFVKCKDFAKSNFWYLPINANIDEKLFKKIKDKLRIN